MTGRVKIKCYTGITVGLLSVLCLFWFASDFSNRSVTSKIKQVSVGTESMNFFDRRGQEILPIESNSQTGESVFDPAFQLLLSGLHPMLISEHRELSIDADLQTFTYDTLRQVADDHGYIGGAGVVMDIKTGELLAFDSYSKSAKTDETDSNNVTNGYIPGSVIKPFIALAALAERTISPEKKILSTGSIELPNAHNYKLPYIFRDWKAHGYVDMREAIGVSSNVYFYAIGGGYQDQAGLGIERLEEYLHRFGFGSKTGIDLIAESPGLVPNPEWKAREFNGEAWRVGDTYLVSIGQHGYAVTPLQMVRAIAAIANNGKLITPTILSQSKPPVESISVAIREEDFKVVQDGMKYAVMNGTASGLYLEGVNVAAKTGTAEVDSEKRHIHSWVTGYFPHDNPQYAFTFMLEQGPWGEEVGAVSVAQKVLRWVRDNRPDYLSSL